MKRLISPLAAAVVLLLGATQATATSTPPQTSLNIFDGVLAIAGWSLSDSFNTSLIVAGNDIFSGSTNGEPHSRFSSVLVDFNQHFCDSATDQLVFRDLSALPTVDPSAVVVDQGLAQGTVKVTIQLSGIEQRVPSCANPDFSQRTFSFPSTSITLSFQWKADSTGKAFDQFVGHQILPGQVVFVVKNVLGQRSASVSGSVTSPLPYLNLPDLGSSTPFVSFLVHTSFTTVQIQFP